MKSSSSVRELLIASGLYATSSIIGPLVIFGGTGLALDNVFGTGPWLLLGGVLIAFIMTNVLLFKKIMKLSREMEVHGTQKEEGNKTQKPD